MSTIRTKRSTPPRDQAGENLPVRRVESPEQRVTAQATAKAREEETASQTTALNKQVLIPMAEDSLNLTRLLMNLRIEARPTTKNEMIRESM